MTEEKVIGIFKYGATYGFSLPKQVWVCSIREAIFTDSRLLLDTVNASELQIKNADWKILKDKITPAVDYEEKIVTKDMLSFWSANFYIKYESINKIQIYAYNSPDTDSMYNSSVKGDIVVSIYYSQLPEGATNLEFYITKKSLPNIAELIKKTPLAQKLELLKTDSSGKFFKTEAYAEV